MELTPLGIEGAWLAESPVWPDSRGYFSEWYRADDVKNATGFSFNTNQANLSLSKARVVRGIHFSKAKQGQAKWISCMSGEILDVIVDIRRESSTFGKWVSVPIPAGAGRSILIASGLGHGFVSMKNETVVSYLLTSNYAPEEEYALNPLDQDLNINWGFEKSRLILSEKDLGAPSFNSLD